MEDDGAEVLFVSEYAAEGVKVLFEIVILL